MTPKRLIGLCEEDARLLCEHYNYGIQVSREDDDYYFVTTVWSSEELPCVVVEIENGKVVKAY